ncbi:hypothetical protein HHL26_04695 [Sphingobium sp. TB-6]|uniref:hypothetical protein n=1 Tax=Sphingobium sp. TB-6 TaxID=2728850 RepID=UPI00146F3188|nr:hypothetical protein [Sphingobium sp. TB-6]NML88364.1 hypothetical protein [Sphingobium sp. TB-6]
MKGLLTAIRLIFGVAGQLLVEVARWLLADLRRLAIVVLIALCIWFHGQASSNRDLAQSRKAQAGRWYQTFRTQKAEMLKLVGLIREARREAANKDRENDARVQREWNAHLQEVTNDYRTDVVAARAELARRLRDASQRSSAGSAASGSGTAALSSLSTLSAGTVRPGETAIVDVADLGIGTDNTVTLEHLIDAWKRAAAIDVNGQR